jgi:hypothetical protein
MVTRKGRRIMEELKQFVLKWQNRLDDDEIVKIIKMCSEALLKEKTEHITKTHEMEITEIYKELDH